MDVKKTILIVDDMAENIEILNNLLHTKYRVKVARNGFQALKIVKIPPMPNLILLDIMMPDMDGYEVIKNLKNDPETAMIPVIFISAKGEAIDQTKGFELGGADYIIKPISPPVVMARVSTHLALHEREMILKARVDEEVEKRLEQEKILLRQARLAAMGEMMSAITHQWNQPISVIGTVSTSLQFSLQMGEFDKEDFLNELAMIDKNIEFMSQTMLNFKGYFKPEKEQILFKAGDEIEYITSMLQPVFKSKGIALEISIPDDVTAFGLPSEFKQVILNLLSNAKDAIIQRQQNESFVPLIKIAGERNDDISIVHIIDNGGGIPSDIIDNIFNDYFTTKGELGTGIGLAISKMIIKDQMHGAMEVYNEDDGAHFILKFPAFNPKQLL